MNKIYQKPSPGGKPAGFTLIELLIVVLIIGILTAAAVPLYEKAVWKSRAAALQIWAAKTLQAEEQYFLSNGRYTSCLDQLDIDYASAFPRVVEQDSGWFDGGGWADNCVLTVQTDEQDFPGITLSLKTGYVRAVFASGKYERNGFGVYLPLTASDRVVGGLWGTCAQGGDNTGWRKFLSSMGYTRVVVGNYACYQQVNQ